MAPAVCVEPSEELSQRVGRGCPHPAVSIEAADELRPRRVNSQGKHSELISTYSTAAARWDTAALLTFNRT
jgi:hypothetical protein